jgi:hypothetical protein
MAYRLCELRRWPSGDSVPWYGPGFHFMRRLTNLSSSFPSPATDDDLMMLPHAASVERNALRAPLGNATKKFSKRILFVAVLRSYRCDHRGNTIVIVTGVQLKRRPT